MTSDRLSIENGEKKPQHARFESDDKFSTFLKEFKSKIAVKKQGRKALVEEFCKSMINNGQILLHKIPTCHRNMLIEDHFDNKEAKEMTRRRNNEESDTPSLKSLNILMKEKSNGRVLRSAKSSNSSDASSSKSVSSNKSVKRTKSQKKTTAKKITKIEKQDNDVEIKGSKTPVIVLKDCDNAIKLESSKPITTTKMDKLDYYQCTLSTENQPSFVYVIKNKPAAVLPNMRLISIDDDVENIHLDENTRKYLEVLRNFLNTILQ